MIAYHYYDVEGDADGLLLKKSDADALVKQGKLNTTIFKLRFTLLGRNDQDAECRLQNMKACSRCR